MNFLQNGPETAPITLLFTHGAGAGMDSDFMDAIADGVGRAGIRVLRFEFPYMSKQREAGRKYPPNPLAVLQAHFRLALENVEGPVVVAGKSMGGRVATTIVEESSARGCVVLGYPFHPPGKPDSLRIEHLNVITKPLLILQGTKDAFGKQSEFSSDWIPSHASIQWMQDGDHSFKTAKKSTSTLEANISAAVQSIVEFCNTCLAEY